MTYEYREKKIVAVLSDELPLGLAMNALAHSAFSAGKYADISWMGKEKMEDANGTRHTGIARYPFIILKASKEEVQKITENARKEGLLAVDYPQEMFDTGHDDELVEALQKATLLEYHACVLMGPAEKIKSLTGHLRLYK